VHNGLLPKGREFDDFIEVFGVNLASLAFCIIALCIIAFCRKEENLTIFTQGDEKDGSPGSVHTKETC